MSIRRGFALALSLVAPFLLLHCGGDDDSATGGEADGGTSDAAPTPTTATDARVDNSLEAASVGAPTTMASGPLVLIEGRAQWRAASTGGGRLTVTLAEATGGRIVEITLRDDDGTPDPTESFVAAASTAMAERAYVSTIGAKRWLAEGDGTVVVEAFGADSVTLKLNDVGQFATGDTFALRGRVTVPVVALPDTTDTRGSSLTLSNAMPEPFTNEPANMATTTGVLTAASTTLGDEPVAYSHEQRSMVLVDTQLATRRNLVVSFPRGHLPRAGEVLQLNDFDSIRVAYTEGMTLDDTTKLWEADQGSAVVTERTTTTLSLELRQARLQSEAPDAKGMFVLDGILRVATPPGG